MSITLPTTPDGDQYEDFVAACLRALGYFTETHLVLRDQQKEVLELDIVATATGDPLGKSELFEAKRDGMKFENVFKLFGQRTYLKIPSATLVSLHTAEPRQVPVYVSRAQEMDVRIVHLPPSPDGASALAPVRNGLSDAERHAVVEVAWYQHIAKRLALAAFNKVATAKDAPEVCSKAKEYLFGVYAGFFQQTPLARAEALYSAWMANPNLAGEAVAHLAAQEKKTDRDVWNRVNDHGEHLWVQMIMHLEGVARLRIIKNALHDFIQRGPKPTPTSVLKIGSVALNVPIHSLPASFHQGLKSLQAHPHALRLPYLFQVFAELLGGFLVFNDQEELAFVERLTGVPAGEVRSSLELVNNFFAAGGGSMLYQQANELLLLKMTPGFVRGGGSFLRQSLFDLREYSDRYKQGWLLGRWHNATYHLLEPTLKAPPLPPQPPTPLPSDPSVPPPGEASPSV